MKTLIILALSLAFASCASLHTKTATTAATGSATTRTPSSDPLLINLQDVEALQKSYFSARGPNGQTQIRGYSAYILKPVGESYTGRVIVYLEDPSDSMKQKLVVSNDKFIFTGGEMAGDEPSFATNRKDSLLIQSGNDGYGRSAWYETVTVALRQGQLVVAGYDFTARDKLGQDRDYTCSVNFLTGRGVLTVYPPRETSPNGNPKVKNFRLSGGVTLLNNWTENSKPAQCGQLD